MYNCIEPLIIEPKAMTIPANQVTPTGTSPPVRFQTQHSCRTIFDVSMCGGGIQTRHTELVFCSPNNISTKIYIPYSALSENGNNDAQWGSSYDWYATIGRGWGSLIRETGYDWSSWSLETVVHTRAKFTIAKTGPGLVLTSGGGAAMTDSLMSCLET